MPTDPASIHVAATERASVVDVFEGSAAMPGNERAFAEALDTYIAAVLDALFTEKEVIMNCVTTGGMVDAVYVDPSDMLAAVLEREARPA